MILEFINGPHDGERVDGADAEKFMPHDIGDCLVFPSGHVYGFVEENNGVAKFKFIKTLSKSERQVMRVCEFKEMRK